MKVDAIIVGSGIIGMALAISLSKKGKKVVIIEKNLSNTLQSNRVYSITRKTRLFFESIDIWKDIDDINNIVNINLYYRDFKENNILNFSEEYKTENIGYIAQSTKIILPLLNQIKKSDNIVLYDNCIISTLDNSIEKVIVITDNKKNIEARYIFSCEGSSSEIKKKLKIENFYDDYNSKALVFNIEHENKNNNTAYQVFLESGPIAFLPISSNLFSMVVSIKNKFFEKEYFKEANICNFIKKITDNKFGDLKMTSKIISFKLIGCDLSQYKQKSVIFVGDSAHSVHPIAGMGLNLGISDIIEIIREINNDKKNFYNVNFFVNYARNQKIINKKARQQLKLIEKIFSIENKLANEVIKIAMHRLQRSDFLKNRIIKHANNNLNFF